MTTELVLRACRAADVQSAVTPRDFPLERRRLPAGARGRGRGGRRALRPAPPGQVRGRAGGNPPGAARGSERAMDAIRARLREGGPVTCEDLQTLGHADLQRRGRDGRRPRPRLGRGADDRRPRARPRPDRRGRADRRRPFPARSRIRLLLGHDEDVLPRRASRGARPLPRARPGGARPRVRDHPARDQRLGGPPGRLRPLRGARVQDPALEGARRGPGGRLLPQPRPRRRARGARAARRSAGSARRSWSATCSRSSPASTGRASAAAASRTSWLVTDDGCESSPTTRTISPSEHGTVEIRS